MKDLEEYVKEFVCHLREFDYAEGTISGYSLAVKMLLCDITPVNRKKKKELIKQGIKLNYSLKWTPETLTWEYIKDYVLKLKKSIAGNTQKIRLSGIKEYLMFIRDRYENRAYDDYEEGRKRFEGKQYKMKDILRPDTPKKTEKTVILTDEEQNAILKKSEVNLRDNIILNLFCHIGQRKCSMEGLNKDDIDHKPKTSREGRVYYELTINILKGRDAISEVVPIPQELKDMLDKYLDSREDPKQDGYISTSYRQKLYHKDAMFLNGCGSRFTKSGIYKMVKRYADKCGIEKRVYPHLYRHIVATKLNSAGLSDAQIKKITLHSEKSDALNTYKNPLQTEVVDKVFPVLKTNTQNSNLQQEPKPQPTPPQPQQQLKPQPQVQQQLTSDQLMQMIIQLKQENEALKKGRYDISIQ